MPRIIINNEMEIEHIRISSELLSKMFGELSSHIKPGITKLELDKIAEEYIRDNNAIPAFKGYKGFPNTLCISENDKVVHGIPDKNEVKEGDVLSIDCGVLFEGYYSDSAFTYCVGNVDEKSLNLVTETYNSLEQGIKFLRHNSRLGDYGYFVQNYIEGKGYSVVRSMVGHGIGKKLHEDPEVCNYGKRGQGIKLVKGMVLAVEPMINLGKHKIYIDGKDKWTVRTSDGTVSAHFEHVVAVGEDEPKVLTDYKYIFNAINKSEWLNKHLLNKKA